MTTDSRLYEAIADEAPVHQLTEAVEWLFDTWGDELPEMPDLASVVRLTGERFAGGWCAFVSTLAHNERRDVIDRIGLERQRFSVAG